MWFQGTSVSSSPEKCLTCTRVLPFTRIGTLRFWTTHLLSMVSHIFVCISVSFCVLNENWLIKNVFPKLMLLVKWLCLSDSTVSLWWHPATVTALGFYSLSLISSLIHFHGKTDIMNVISSTCAFLALKSHNVWMFSTSITALVDCVSQVVCTMQQWE